MSYESEFLAYRKKWLKEKQNKVDNSVKTNTSANDIGPVKETEKRTWFQGGAFSDGYQFGDIAKTI